MLRNLQRWCFASIFEYLDLIRYKVLDQVPGIFYSGTLFLVPGVSTRYKVPEQKYQVLCQVLVTVQYLVLQVQVLYLTHL